MAKMASLHVSIHGLVQGVFFRVFVAEKATMLGLTGWVRNLPGGSEVEVLAEGDEASLKKLVEYVKKGPPRAEVMEAAVEWGEFSDKFKRFEIRY